jgi:hypothetical protein
MDSTSGDVIIGAGASSYNCELKSETKKFCQKQKQFVNHDGLEFYKNELKRLKENGKAMRSDQNQPAILDKPSWFNAALFENAKSVYARHFMGINFAHLSGLILLVRMNSIFLTLSSTGKSDSVAKLFKRYYKTLCHVKTWYEGDIFERDSDAQRSLLTVRGMHNKVSSTLNDRKNGRSPPSRMDANGNVLESQIHICQYDIMITQFAFVGFIVTNADKVGLMEDFNRFDLESILHFWRVIGYYLGVNEENNLCSRQLDDIVNLCKTIMEDEFKQSIRANPTSSPPGIMGYNIVRSVKFIPMLTFYGITKYLFELMGLDTSELETKPTRYSRLSYTLIKLVMSNLLAYRPLRWFNNGLTRLSVFCVGKVENWFSNHLHNKYGPILRI